MVQCDGNFNKYWATNTSQSLELQDANVDRRYQLSLSRDAPLISSHPTEAPNDACINRSSSDIDDDRRAASYHRERHDPGLRTDAAFRNRRNMRRRPSSQDGQDEHAAYFRQTGSTRLMDNLIIMPQFDGSGDLELFLKRFQSIAACCNWNESEMLFGRNRVSWITHNT